MRRIRSDGGGAAYNKRAASVRAGQMTRPPDKRGATRGYINHRPPQLQRIRDPSRATDETLQWHSSAEPVRRHRTAFLFGPGFARRSAKTSSNILRYSIILYNNNIIQIILLIGYDLSGVTAYSRPTVTSFGSFASRFVGECRPDADPAAESVHLPNI